jgi:hypothetical protein
MFLTERTLGYVMPPERSVDLDELADFEAAEAWLRRTAFELVRDDGRPNEGHGVCRLDGGQTTSLGSDFRRLAGGSVVYGLGSVLLRGLSFFLRRCTRGT